jgi:transcriptional regulator with XRE-family HTH domain
MSEVIRQGIRESGLTLVALGKRSGVSPGQLSRFVRGERDLTLSVGLRVAEALGLQLVKPRRKKGGHRG